MKTIYINKETGKEVHYGENITFKESGRLANGYSYSSETTLPIINETIPDLIKKGVLVQKEVKEKEAKRSNPEYTVDEKLDILATTVSMLLKQILQLQQDFYGDEDDDEGKE